MCFTNATAALLDDETNCQKKKKKTLQRVFLWNVLFQKDRLVLCLFLHFVSSFVVSDFL